VGSSVSGTDYLNTTLERICPSKEVSEGLGMYADVRMNSHFLNTCRR